MGNMLIFVLLLVTVNALVTSLLMRGVTNDPRKFFLRWCGIILGVQLIAIVAAILLPMDEEGLPFVFAFLAPIAACAFFLKKTIKKMNENKDKKTLQTLESYWNHKSWTSSIMAVRILVPSKVPLKRHPTRAGGAVEPAHRPRRWPKQGTLYKNNSLIAVVSLNTYRTSSQRSMNS